MKKKWLALALALALTLAALPSLALAAAEKYRGAVLAEKEGGWFSLRVLLNIP